MTKTVLITGASGFIAAHVVRVFLQAGYHVRGTVRSDSTAEQVRKAHSAHANDTNLSFAIVKDITHAGAFDEAVKGVDGVIHTASPFILNAKDFEKDLWQPAIHGTTAVLQAIKTHNPNVKRVVITASFASIVDYQAGRRPGYTYTEADWNPMSKAEAKDPVSAYNVSKALAERAAFDFVHQQKPNFTVATLQPPMVYGPLAKEFASMDKLNTSSADFYRLINGSLKRVPETGFFAYVDVRDLATAHLLAYEASDERAGNERFVVSSGAYTYSQFCDVARRAFPELKGRVPEEGAYEKPETYVLDGSKAIEVLGLKYRTMEETVVDTVRSLLELEARLGVKY